MGSFRCGIIIDLNLSSFGVDKSSGVIYPLQKNSCLIQCFYDSERNHVQFNGFSNAKGLIFSPMDSVFLENQCLVPWFLFPGRTYNQFNGFTMLKVQFNGERTNAVQLNGFLTPKRLLMLVEWLLYSETRQLVSWKRFISFINNNYKTFFTIHMLPICSIHLFLN